jgi:hypothetical protein
VQNRCKYFVISIYSNSRQPCFWVNLCIFKCNYYLSPIFLAIKYCNCDHFCIVTSANCTVKIFANPIIDNLILFIDDTTLVQKNLTQFTQ